MFILMIDLQLATSGQVPVALPIGGDSHGLFCFIIGMLQISYLEE